MIKIDICDDEPFWIERAHQLVSDYFCERKDIEIYTFNNTEHLLNVLIEKKEYADIVILDIDMPVVDGFQAAGRLNEIYPDLLLLFYTSHEQYVFDSFQFRPFRYIRKNHIEQEMKLALSAADDVLKKRSIKSVLLKTKDENCLIDIKNIVWFETDKRRCNVHLGDGNVLNVGMSIKELMAQINSPDFIMIHSGAAVNTAYIKRYSSYDITLENNVHLIVSRGRMSDVKQAVMRYWRNRI